MDDKVKQSIAEVLEVEVASLTSNLELASLETWDSVNKLTLMVLLGDALGRPVEFKQFAQLVVFSDIEKLFSAPA